MTEALVSLLKAAALPFGLVALARLLTRRLDQKGLFQPLAFGIVPLLAGAALEFACLRANGLLAALDPLAVWSPDSIWHVSWNVLVARYLAPEILLAGLARAAPWQDWQIASAFGLVALGLAAASLRAASTWRLRQAWRGPLLFTAWSSAWTAVLHGLLVLTFWTIHWLNFWLFFILLLFVELRRREGGSKYQAS